MLIWFVLVVVLRIFIRCPLPNCNQQAPQTDHNVGRNHVDSRSPVSPDPSQIDDSDESMMAVSEKGLALI